MSKQDKVVKFKKRRGINIGIIVFLILFLYIAINVYIYFTKDKLSIYEVHEGTTAIDNHVTGLILRDEKIIYSTQAGYITYYLKEGARAAKNTAVYSVDENGQLYDFVANNGVTVSLSQRNYDEIRHDISDFQRDFSENNFSCVYNFKENAQGTILDILNDIAITKGQEIMENTGITYSNNMVASEESGIVSYYMDSYEGMTPENITEASFSQDNYQRISLRTTEMVPQDSPVYKLITSDTWYIVLQLSKAQYDLLADKENVTFKVLNDDFEMEAAIKLLSSANDTYFAQLTMKKYLPKYLEDRFLDIELDFDTVKGLKIPTSAITEKDFYEVPLGYFAEGSESKELGLTVKSFDSKTGEITYTHVPTDIYYQDDTTAYVDTDLFEPNTIIQSPIPPTGGNTGEYVLSKTKRFQGVYNVNLGYAVFKRIEILSENNDYCIIAKNTPKGLSPYDHIALDGSKAVDEAIIY